MRHSADSPPHAVILDPNDGGLAMTRALSRRGIRVVVLSNRSEAWVGRSRGATGIELPSLAGAEQRWIEQIVGMAAGGDGVLVPCSDRACALLAQRRAEIPTRLRSFESPESAHMRLMDKASLYEAAADVGVRHPWWRILRTERDMETIGRQAEYPCLLKPTLSHEWRRLFGLERVFLIESPSALADRARPALAAGLELMLTEHVAGPETNLEAHVALRLADGSYPVDYTRRKLRQYPLDFGASTTVVTDDAPRTRELSRHLLDSTGFVGVASLETKLDAETGEPVLIEVNVRIPHDLGLGDAAGADASHRVYGALAGLPLGPALPARAGVKCVVPALEVRAARARLGRGDVRPLELLRSYRGLRDVGVLDLRDPGPAMALARRLTADRLHRGESVARQPSAAILPRALLLDPQDAGVAIARRLVRRGVPVLSLGSASASWVARSRGVVGVELPSIAQAPERWVETLIELAAGGDGVLIPCSDRASTLLAEHRAEIPACLRSFESSESEHLRLMDKASLYEAAADAGVRHPWWRILRSERDLETVGRDAEYPCLLKPTLSHEWRQRFGDERVFVIESCEALDRRARPALAAGVELMLTEHVPGPETNLDAHVAVRLADGSYPVDYTRRKLRQYPLDFGAGATLISDDAPATRALSRRLLDSVGFVGVAQTEAKVHPETGEPVLIEVNVRVPRDVGLGDVAGTDVSYRVYAALAGLPLGPPPAARNGVKIVVPALEVRAAWERLRAGDIGFLELLRSYRGVRELGPLNLRDPMPALALGARMIRDRVRSVRS